MSNTTFLLFLFIPALLLSPLLLFWDLWLYKFRWRKAPRCPKCKYNFSDKQSLIYENKQQRKEKNKAFSPISCSECGYELKRFRLAYRNRRNWFLSGLRLLLATLFVIPAIFFCYDYSLYQREAAALQKLEDMYGWKQVESSSSYSGKGTFSIWWHERFNDGYASKRPDIIRKFYKHKKSIRLFIQDKGVDIAGFRHFRFLKEIRIATNRYGQEKISNPSPKINDIGQVRQLTKISLYNFIGINPVTFNEMPNLTTLSFNNADLKDLGALHNPNLKRLHLMQNKPTALTSLHGNNLEELSLTGYQFSSDTLKRMSSIESLILRQCDLIDLDKKTPFLNGFSQLNLLYITHMPLVDIKMLDQRSPLEKLWIEDVEQIKLGGVKSFANIVDLSLNSVTVDSLDELTTLPHLHEMRLIKVRCLKKPAKEFLASCKALNDLKLLDCEISSLEGIDQLPRLRWVEISQRHGDTVLDLSPLSKCNSLLNLTIVDATEVPMKALLALPNLRSLSLPALTMDVLPLLKNFKGEIDLTLPESYKEQLVAANLPASIRLDFD